MSAIEDLYNGKVYIAESATPDTEQYRTGQEQMARLAEELRTELPATLLEKFEAYCRAYAVVSGEVHQECFRQGMTLGAKLERELHPRENEKETDSS